MPPGVSGIDWHGVIGAGCRPQGVRAIDWHGVIGTGCIPPGVRGINWPGVIGASSPAAAPAKSAGETGAWRVARSRSIVRSLFLVDM